jgi:hypothetical protein
VTTTFQKRQKEMKRMEKARMKAERREQKKLEPKADEETIELLYAPPALDLDLDSDPTAPSVD